MRKKQLTAMFLSAAMVLTSSGISFAAQNVGTPGAVKDWGDQVWITLDANGGEFLLEAENSATPDNATANTASKADSGTKTSKTLKAGGRADNEDANGYYLTFGAAVPGERSAKGEWDPLAMGPESAPSQEVNLEFAGWYTDETMRDLSTRLEADSKLYGQGTVYARWVNPDQAEAKDEYAETYVKDVKVSGLKEDSKLVFAELEEEKKKDVKGVAALLEGTKFSSHKLSQDSSALVQLDISVDGTHEGPVGITMNDPFGGKYDHVLAIHLNDEGTQVKDGDIQSAVLDKEAGTLSFTARSFSPYILAGVDAKMVKIKIENVKNGALVAWSEKHNDDGTYTCNVVPIGEEVEIPAGTELWVEGYGVETEEDFYYLKNGCFQASSEGKTENFEESSLYIVSEDAVLSGEFVLDDEEYEKIFSVTPDFLLSPGAYEGTVTGSVTAEDGTKIDLIPALFEESDGEQYLPDNDLFTLEDGILKSKEDLKAGRYTLCLKGLSSEGEMLSYEGVTITVSSWKVEVKPNRIPKPGMFEGTVETRVMIDGKWSQEQMPVELDYPRGKNDNDLFTLENNELKSIGELELGAYGLDLRVELPCGYPIKRRVTVYVGTSSYFYIPLAQYEYSEGGETYKEYISMHLGAVHEEEGALFEDAEKDFHERRRVKEITMYGDHAFKGWVDDSGKAIVGSEKLKERNDFIASFENYKPVAVGGSGSAEPPENPNKPGNSGGSSSSGGGSSSGGSRSSSGDTISGDWKRDEKGWWLQLKNGDYAKNQWGKINNVWYFFGADGYMLTGWQLINGKWYYLTETEASQGAMVTGWHYNEGYKAWFYLNADGEMLTGWQLINDTWYYLNPVSDGTQGSMAADTYIGEYYVNADGAWAQ